jgi:hypothetical protein
VTRPRGPIADYRPHADTRQLLASVAAVLAEATECATTLEELSRAAP